MQQILIPAPEPDEYAGFYAGYVERVRPETVAALLRDQPARLRALTAGVPKEREGWRYADGKWSIREVVGHMSDAERVFAYRLLRIARGDTTPLPGFEQDPYVEAGRFDRRPLAELVEEFTDVRRATFALVRSLDDVELRRTGTASDTRISARALVYAIAGHADNHLDGLRDRYGLGVARAS
jgi:hypothetical protein